MALLLASSAALGEGTMRIASFNASLNRASAGGLVADLATGSDPQARVIAEIIQRVRPDVLLLNEFDFDADQEGARLFAERYLASPQGGAEAIHYAHRFSAPVNTGVPSGFDLDRDGRRCDRGSHCWHSGCSGGIQCSGSIPPAGVAASAFCVPRDSRQPAANAGDLQQPRGGAHRWSADGHQVHLPGPRPGP